MVKEFIVFKGTEGSQKSTIGSHPLSLLFSGYWVLSLGGGVTLTAHLLIVPRLRMYGVIAPLPSTFALRGA